MTRRERLSARAERRRAWAGSRRAKANAAFEASRTDEARTGIPMGQPVLVGHHSEGRHRRALARADAAASRSVEHANVATEHAAKAESIERQLKTSIFSDDPDAVDALEAKLAKLEAERAEIKALNARCRKGDEAAIAEVKRRHPHWASCGDDPTRGLPAYKLTNLGGEISRARKRIDEVKARAERTAKAELAGGVVLSSSGEWCSVTFAEKPERAILNDLHAAGFSFRGGTWRGRLDALPESVRALLPS